MALDKDEAKLVEQVYEKEQDFYAPLLALVLFRYQRRNIPIYGLPPDQIGDLVVECYDDLQAEGEET